MTTQEAERQRIALELHDETAQDLTAALLALRQAESAAPGDAAAAAAEATRKLIEDTITNVRELAVELRPKALDDFGLGPAVERLAADITQRTGIRVDVEVRTGEDRLPRETELTVFRTVQEILGQMAYPGPEGGTVQIVIERAHEEVRVLINRDSRDGGTRTGAQRVELGGLGERVRLVGGRLSATSGTSGATVRVVLPL
jgi:signal transduction histidine kinase